MTSRWPQQVAPDSVMDPFSMSEGGFTSLPREPSRNGDHEDCFYGQSAGSHRHLVPCRSQLIGAPPWVAGAGWGRAALGGGSAADQQSRARQARAFPAVLLPRHASGHQGSLAFRRGRAVAVEACVGGDAAQHVACGVSLGLPDSQSPHGHLRSWTGCCKGIEKGCVLRFR